MDRDYEQIITNHLLEYNIEDTPTNRAEYRELLHLFAALQPKNRKELFKDGAALLKQQDDADSNKSGK